MRRMGALDCRHDFTKYVCIYIYIYTYIYIYIYPIKYFIEINSEFHVFTIIRQ